MTRCMMCFAGLMVCLLLQQPVMHAQTARLTRVAGRTTADSFWVGQQPEGGGARHKRTTPAVAKEIAKSRASGTVTGFAPGGDGQKTNESIASELAGSKSVPWAIVVGLTLITLLPAILLSMTPMIRLLVVFHFLRQALGTQTAPSNQVLMGLALMMTWFVMQPVLLQVQHQAVEPFQQGKIDGMTAISRGTDPPRRFMLQYAREKDLALFVHASGMAR